MPATTIGSSTTLGNWGVGADEPGIVISSFDVDYNASVKELPDRSGCAIGVAYYNEKGGVSITGYIIAASTFTGKIGSVITLTNTISLAPLQATTSNGKTICDNIKRSRQNEDWERLDVSATFYPLVTS